MRFPTIRIEGNIISEEILEKIEQGDLSGQSSQDYGFQRQVKLRDEITAAWSAATSQWKVFKLQMDKAGKGTTGVSETRKYWMVPFLGLLGYELDSNREAWTINNKTYAISHRTTNRGDFPVHIMGFNDSLDVKRNEGGPRMSPHSLVQEYINITDSLYAIVSNGLTIRLLRDSSRLVKLSYLEFDLEQMFEEEHFADFSIFYRLIHVSRMPEDKDRSASAIIEKYHQDSIDSGARIREGLSKAVEKSLVSLGKGFLSHQINNDLRDSIETEKLRPDEFYRNIRRLIYRLLFLMVAEDRDLIFPSTDKMTSDEKEKQSRFKEYYKKYYSIDRLRILSGKPYLYSKESTDLWKGLLSNFRLFEDVGYGLKMGIYPLDGFLFSPKAIEWLEGSVISNELLLGCIRELNWFKNAQGLLTRINYGSLDVEELGSVYEGLLELQPVIEQGGDVHSNWSFTFREGTDRKTSGSYYTRPDLVHELIKSALLPVIEDKILQAKTKEDKSNALLSLKVCDSAAGSGHILLAAARAIAWQLAKVKTDEENPTPGVYRQALREVIQHCIYGVDMNPDAVELCQLALWIEGHNSGKPLSFLEHKIRCGNSLVGVSDISILKKGIPDEAFNPTAEDDKVVCQALKKANRAYNKTQQGTFDFTSQSSVVSEQKDFAREYHELDLLKQDTVEEIKSLGERYGKLRNNPKWFKDWCASNLYTSAFFYTYTKLDDPAAPSSERLANYINSSGGVEQRAIAIANVLGLENKYFHWPLEFPDVFDQGGFDVMMGNPPWEKLQAEEQEFFKARHESIAEEKDSATRKELIEALRVNDPNLYNDWTKFKNAIIHTSKFIINSNRFPYSAKGNLNLYKVFVELVRSFLSTNGKAGLVIQSGLFTDELSKEILENLMHDQNLISVYDFVNTNKLFHIHGQMRFSLITLAKKKNEAKTIFKFYLKSVDEISRNDNGVQIDYNDIKLINPNTFVCPQVSFQYVLDLLKKLYSNKLVIHSPIQEKSFEVGFWGEMFNMTRAKKYLFNSIDVNNQQFSPLYEAKYFHQFDHRFATFEGKSIEDCIKGNTEYLNESQKAELKEPVFRYFVERAEVLAKCERYSLEKDWLLCVRSITSATNERTVISSIIPKYGVGNSANIALINEPLKACHLIATLNSLVIDFIAQMKVGNQNFNIYIIEQLPIIDFQKLDEESILFIIPKVLELTYNSWDIKSFADDIWDEANTELRNAIQEQIASNEKQTGGYVNNPPASSVNSKSGIKFAPFKWNEDRRMQIRAELDAYYAKLYDLTEEEVKYILEPQDVFGENFPGETFRVLKDKDIRKFGEYRTKRLVLEAWDKLN
jgi:hypothetical protein